jgi:transposase
MSETYIGAIKDHCPNATLVLDRFHIVKALNEAVDEVRKEQWREASKADRKALKGLRWLLYRYSSTRTRQDTRNLKALDNHNRRIDRAWRLKEEFEHFWDYKATWAAERFVKHWTKSALLSRLEASSSTPCAGINRRSWRSSIPGPPTPSPKASIASSEWSTTAPAATAISMPSPT